MSLRIAVIQGHPDPRGNHLCHALAAAYAEGARTAGHALTLIEIAKIDFPVLRSAEQWEKGELPLQLKEAQAAIGQADHLVIIYPLWLGTMPALLKAFLEQVLRPGFAVNWSEDRKSWTRRLSEKSARIVVTMGMPALVYRWFFGAHSLKNLERNILGFCGIKPIKETLIGTTDAIDAPKGQKWLTKMHTLGRRGM